MLGPTTECPECNKILERRIRKGEIIYPCDDCSLEVMDWEGTQEYIKNLKVNEIVEVFFRDPGTNDRIENFITTIIPEKGSVVEFGSKFYRVSEKIYYYSYIEDADKTHVKVDLLLDEEKSIRWENEDRSNDEEEP